MTENRKIMENLLETARNYMGESETYPRKRKATEFINKEKSQWMFGNNILKEVDKYTYLGSEVSKEKIGGEKQRQINEGKAMRRHDYEWREQNKYEVGRSL